MSDTMRAPTRAFSMTSHPEIVFIELSSLSPKEPKHIVVQGPTREERDNASDRLAAVMVEFGCRFEDMIFHDADDVTEIATN